MDVRLSFSRKENGSYIRATRVSSGQNVGRSIALAILKVVGFPRLVCWLSRHRPLLSPTSSCYLFVCFVISFILGVRLHLSVNMWTHQPGSHRRKAIQEIYFYLLLFFSAFLLRCLP